MIKHINESSGWWYKACSNCKSSTQSHNDNFWCNNKCDILKEPPVSWYIVYIFYLLIA
uniref:Uncharacterized protein n=1 Tax=Manihot esculenta TaxID=3983 RepID=A0A2C9VVM9_MANES